MLVLCISIYLSIDIQIYVTAYIKCIYVCINIHNLEPGLETQQRSDAGKSFQKLIKSNRNQIVFTIH